jgi:AraC-like DNA-binding protein
MKDRVLIKEHVPRDPFLQDLCLCYFGEEECRPSHSWGPAVKDHYKIHIIFNGGGCFESAGRSYRLSRGQVFLIPPHRISEYRADEADPWHYGWLGFNGLAAMHLLEQAGLSEGEPVMRCDRIEELRGLIASMSALSRGSEGCPFALTGLLYQCLSILIDSREKGALRNARSQEGRKGFYVRSVLEYIETNYSSGLSVGAIAEYVGLQRSYLSGLFHKQFGCSIQEYLIRYRIRIATGLMENWLLTIGDIARSVGYQDSLLFSKTFRKAMGVSPSEYRRRMVGEGASASRA